MSWALQVFLAVTLFGHLDFIECIGEDVADFQCLSEAFLGTAVKPLQKGMVLDDTTALHCSSKLLSTWPHTSQGNGSADKVMSLRIVKPWSPEWPEELRESSWASLVQYIHRNKVQVLLGTSIGCNEVSDRQTWNWTKALIQLIGPEHLMGLAIGEELEMFNHRLVAQELNVSSAECLDKLWKGNYAFDWFRQVVSEFDAMGYGAIPVTSVFGSLALASASNATPFYEAPEAQVNTFLSKVIAEYKKRYVFTWKFYPCFDGTLGVDKDINPASEITQASDLEAEGSNFRRQRALAVALCWDPGCSLPATAAVARRKMTLLTGDPSWRMWLGELGCSSPLSPSLISAVKGGFLDWDLSIGLATDLLTSLEHVFWFTMRDALGHQGIPEFFGLMSGDCSDQNCKLKAASQSTFPVVPRSKVPADSYETGKSDKLVPGHLFARQGSHAAIVGGVFLQMSPFMWPQPYGMTEDLWTTAEQGGSLTAGRGQKSNVKAVSKEQRQEIKEAFDIFDSERTGKMDYHELKVAIRAMGFEIKKPEALELMARYDREETGSIGYDAFEDILVQRYAAQDPMDEIRKAFELFDEDKRGTISFRNLKRISRDLGEKLTDEELRGMIDEFDQDQDGEINESEFVNIMKQTSLY
ncbi:unnamed protein product [Polarella glacialis]|uniref:EF-hand domain-containing protein n=1 Tax=Polarella glacialis TaxID=89957 RepID=A0A813EK69_POLGL|nr:unnamed protein product [Polarella glacialis]